VCVYSSCPLQLKPHNLYRGGKFVFSTDGAHTKPSAGYLGQLLNFTGVDSQGSPVAIGYALVPQEDADEYQWFFKLINSITLEDGSVLHGILNSPANVIFSDRQKGLGKAVRLQFPLALHLPCCRHLMVKFSLASICQLLLFHFICTSCTVPAIQLPCAYTVLVLRLPCACHPNLMTCVKSSWAPRSPTRTADARPTHRQTVRADQRARGPQRDGIARAAPNHQSEPPGRRRVGEKPTRLRENAWKFRGSKFPPVRETNTVSQGKRLRRCLFLLFGSTESEAVFVSFVWVNSCRKD
jgi:hypothetical protein